MSPDLRNPIVLLLIVILLLHIFQQGICEEHIIEEDNKEVGGNSGETPGKVQKHISWISPIPSNFSTICNDSATAQTKLLSCFSEWDKRSVFFYLFNRGRNGSEVLNLGDVDELEKSGYNKSNPLKMIIHGYKMTAYSHFSHLLREAYLEHGNETNVIVVDWRWLASDQFYFNSAFNTRIVGERVGEFLVYLRKTGYLKTFKEAHLIGFSLGAHVASFAAKHVKKTARRRVGRITGLDPAGPSFMNTKPIYRLDAGDAKFVDVIHTCVGHSGITESIGHVDFFPNGGIDQPGCDWERYHSFFLRNCSHERAFQFFLESIKGERYVGCSCARWEEFKIGNCRCNESTPDAELMGEYCSFLARGNKYLATTYDNHYIAF